MPGIDRAKMDKNKIKTIIVIVKDNKNDELYLLSTRLYETSLTNTKNFFKQRRCLHSGNKCKQNDK